MAQTKFYLIFKQGKITGLQKYTQFPDIGMKSWYLGSWDYNNPEWLALKGFGMFPVSEPGHFQEVALEEIVEFASSQEFVGRIPSKSLIEKLIRDEV